LSLKFRFTGLLEIDDKTIAHNRTQNEMRRRDAMSLKRWSVRLIYSAALLTASAVYAEEMVTLKFAHWLPPKHPLHADFVAWGNSVAEASGGTIKVELYPAQQLGKAKDHYDMARDGIADITWVNPGYTPGRFPVISAAELPFIYNNAIDGSAAFDEWYRTYSSREMNDVKLCMAHLHDPGTLHAKKKIVTPDDVKGVKVRPGQGTVAAFANLLGGASVQVSAPESRDALERGVADAITFPWNSILLFGIDKAVSFHMDAPFYVTTFVWVMNKDRYEGLSDRQKKAVDDHCNTEWARKVATPWAKWEAEGRDRLMKMEGHEVYSITDAQLASWRKAAEPLKDKWRKEVASKGLDAEKIFNHLVDTAKKYNSAY